MYLASLLIFIGYKRIIFSYTYANLFVSCKLSTGASTLLGEIHHVNLNFLTTLVTLIKVTNDS